MKKLSILIISLSLLLLTAKSIAAQSLSDYVWNSPPLADLSLPQSADLRQKLTMEIEKMLDKNQDGQIDGHLAPFVFTRGVASHREHYFVNPAETVLTLSTAYPYVPSTTQTKIRAFLSSELASYPPTQVDICSSWGNTPCFRDGIRREYAPVPSAIFGDVCWPNTTYGQSSNECNPIPSLENLYGLWAYEYYVNNWGYLNSTRYNNEVRPIYQSFKNNGAQVRYLSQIGGLIGFARIAQHFGDNTLSQEAANYATTALQAASGNGFTAFRRNSEALVSGYDISWETSAYSYWSHYFTVPLFFYNFRANAQANLVIAYMTLFPREVGLFLRDNAKSQVQDLVNKIESFEPGWELTRSSQSTAGENAYHTQDLKWTLFKLHAYVLGDSQEQLRKYLDVPVGIGDLFYLQMLIAAIEATPTTLPPLTGDVNNDTSVNVLDVQACVNHFLGTQDYGTRADVNQDGSVDVLDVQVIVNIILAPGA